MTHLTHHEIQSIAQSIAAATGLCCTINHQQALGGGSTNRAYRIDTDDGRHYFVKLNQAQLLCMFEAEADGLNALAGAHAIRVPLPVCSGLAADQCWLVTEFIESASGMAGSNTTDSNTADSNRLFGRNMANLHRQSSEQFGWFRDNSIGSTPQCNTYMDNWVDFYRERRLRVQLKLAEHNGFSAALQAGGERLIANLDGFFSAYFPPPSLLHGDLWSGNYVFDRGGHPVIFDPAVYFGDRETDMAMTELFGGFDADFYAGYHEIWPLDDGYNVRKSLYNLYHILNHANLFGGGYVNQAECMIEKLLAEIDG